MGDGPGTVALTGTVAAGLIYMYRDIPCMNRRNFVLSICGSLVASTAGCLRNGDEADVSVPSDEELVDQYVENDASAGGPFEIVDHSGTEVGDRLSIEVTFEHTGDETALAEVDITAYDEDGDLFFVRTDDLRAVGAGETITRDYVLDPDAHDDVEEIRAYDISIIPI